jgi:hypothetical protein
MMHLAPWERAKMSCAAYRKTSDQWLLLAYALAKTGVPVMEALAKTKQEAGAGAFN